MEGKTDKAWGRKGVAMKRSFLFKGGLACVVQISGLLVAQDMVFVSFDTMYPATAYRAALNNCMQLYGQLNASTQSKGMQPQLSQDVVELAIATHASVDNVIRQTEHIQYEDVEYLMALIERMVSRHELLLLEQPTGKIIYGALRESYILLNDRLGR